ncbi:MAG: hypothetical protein ACI94D_002127, partial [Neolewinella sp.]
SLKNFLRSYGYARNPLPHSTPKFISTLPTNSILTDH